MYWNWWKAPQSFPVHLSLHSQQPCMSLLVVSGWDSQMWLYFVMCHRVALRACAQTASAPEPRLTALLSRAEVWMRHSYVKISGVNQMRWEGRNCGKWELLDMFSFRDRAAVIRRATMIMQVLLTGWLLTCFQRWLVIFFFQLEKRN